MPENGRMRRVMSRVLPVNYNGAFCYNILITNEFDGLAEQISNLGYNSDKKLCIVTDSNVALLYAEAVKEELGKKFSNVFVYTVPAGEEHKNVETINGIYEFLIQNRFDRQDALVALGGGVVGDMTGYAAATYLRGIDFIQVPTTLLSQTDSSIGGKTGVDFMQYKNMVGAFYMPRLVYMNLSVLESLPREQLVSGFGEILKHGLIKDIAYFEWLQAHYDEIWMLKYDVLEEMIFVSCDIKRGVVERDPKEKGERALLNFGHTIGHAIEKMSNFELTHGTCVGLGVVAASYLSKRQGSISDEELSMIEQTLARFGLKTRVEGFVAEEVLAATKSDKKMVGSQVKFVLLQNPGNAYIYRDLTDEQILDGISYVLGA